MKKNRINLLINREDYQRYENIFERFKLSAGILTGILAVIFAFFYISIRGKFNTYERMNMEKQNYLLLLTSRRSDEAKINYIEKKYSDLKKFMKDDASSVAYFEILSDSLKSSSDSAKLKSLEVDKARNTNFIVTFSVFDKMMSFLKFAESEMFLNNFETISLKNLVIAGTNKENENYELSFVGRFAPINTKTKK
jgi:hypothetical protein